MDAKYVLFNEAAQKVLFNEASSKVLVLKGWIEFTGIRKCSDNSLWTEMNRRWDLVNYATSFSFYEPHHSNLDGSGFYACVYLSWSGSTRVYIANSINPPTEGNIIFKFITAAYTFSHVGGTNVLEQGDCGGANLGYDGTVDWDLTE